MTNSIAFGYTFPAIRGVQAQNEYYTVMCPLKYVQKLFVFVEEELAPEFRDQRPLNTKRVPQIAKYMINKRDKYVFSSLTACISGDTSFVPVGGDAHSRDIGTLHIDIGAQCFITDGQHRKAAIEKAIQEDPSLENESISVVFFVNRDLKRRQVMFRDLNQYQVKTDPSLSKTFGDSPDDLLSQHTAKHSNTFRGIIDMGTTKLSSRSVKLFSHNALQSANIDLVGKTDNKSLPKHKKICKEFWDCVGENIPHWKQLLAHKVSSRDLRTYFVHSHAVTLRAIARVGKYLLSNDPNWKNTLERLSSIDWHRTNTNDWEGRCMKSERMKNTDLNILLTASLIKQKLGISLTETEKREEEKFLKAK